LARTQRGISDIFFDLDAPSKIAYMNKAGMLAWAYFTCKLSCTNSMPVFCLNPKEKSHLAGG